MDHRPDYSEKKFGQLLLYVAGKMEGDSTFGATKLNKVLFFSDFLFFGTHGVPITGATYQRLPHGPAPRELLPVRDALEGAGDAVVRTVTYLGRPQKRLLPLRSANVNVFNPEELELVDEVIEALWEKTATQVSTTSHILSVGWRVAHEMEVIPYETIFLSQEPISEAEMRRGLELAHEFGLVVASASDG